MRLTLPSSPAACSVCLRIFVPLLMLSAWPAQAEDRQAVRVIFDTDMGPDYDDVGAMAVLHALADQGEANILGTMVSNRMKHSARLVEIINRHYGRFSLPIGALRQGGANIDTWHQELKWTDELPKKFLHSQPDTTQGRDAVDVYRELLSQAPDHSVVIITVGFFTNLAHLLESPADKHSKQNGRQLVQTKVARLVSMAGKFPSGKETNIIVDIPSAQNVFANWPTEIVISGYEIGRHVRTGDRLIATQDDRINDPVKYAYTISIQEDKQDTKTSRYEKGGRASYDQTAVLAAVRGYNEGAGLKDRSLYFNSERGQLTIANDGTNSWAPSPEGKHIRLLPLMNHDDLAREIEDLMMQSPATPPNGGVGREK